MFDCNEHQKLAAYHDGQLDAVIRAEMEQHLAACGNCSTDLAELQNVSRLFADYPVARLSQIALYRLHSNLDLLTDRGLLRLARVMTGLAASVLLLGSLWLMRPHPAVTPINTSVALLPLQIEEQSLASNDPSPSDWMVAELSY